VQATDINGCANLDSIEIVVNDLPVITVSSDGDVSGVVCGGGQVTLAASGAENYQWQGPNGFESNLQNPVIVDFSVDDTGEYTVIGTDENGCANSASVSVDFGENTSVTILTEDVELCPGETLILQGDGAVEYNWIGPNSFSEEGEIVSITNVNEGHSGVYYVSGMDEFGCSGLDSVQVTVAEFQDCLFIPEIVTPNGDNSNDEWVITGIQNYPNAEVSIFNRWGNLIFTVSPYENNWYGQVNKGVNVGDGSGKVPPGTYFYIVDLKDGQTEPFKGYLELQY
jgi:gliding motility-associated-like protein